LTLNAFVINLYFFLTPAKMSLIEQLKQIERIDNLVRKKATGTPKELSNRINVSERQVYNIINLMKDMGAPIFFCTYNRSYCYKKDVIFKFGFLTESRNKIRGGLRITDSFIYITSEGVPVF